MLVVTDPAAGVRPDVPAGYGTGFEHGRIPFCLLHKPRALGAAGGRSFRSSQNGAAESGGVLMDKQLILLESRLHRPHTQLCQVGDVMGLLTSTCMAVPGLSMPGCNAPAWCCCGHSVVLGSTVQPISMPFVQFCIANVPRPGGCQTSAELLLMGLVLKAAMPALPLTSAVARSLSPAYLYRSSSALLEQRVNWASMATMDNAFCDLQVPNAVLVDIKGSAGGCSCIASSRDGRWLAAACADATGRFKVMP